MMFWKGLKADEESSTWESVFADTQQQSWDVMKGLLGPQAVLLWTVLHYEPCHQAASSVCDIKINPCLWLMIYSVIQEMVPEIRLNKLHEKSALQNRAVTKWGISYYSKVYYAKWPIIFYWFSVLLVRKSWVHNPHWSCDPWKGQLKPATGLVEEWGEGSHASSVSLFM